MKIQLFIVFGISLSTSNIVSMLTPKATAAVAEKQIIVIEKTLSDVCAQTLARRLQLQDLANLFNKSRHLFSVCEQENLTAILKSICLRLGDIKQAHENANRALWQELLHFRLDNARRVENAISLGLQAPAESREEELKIPITRTHLKHVNSCISHTDKLLQEYEEGLKKRLPKAQL